MKRAGKPVFRQCTLEPVEPPVPNPLPDVPEHFNYGVFFDDDFDYMRFLKPASEFQTTYRIVDIPENDVLDAEHRDPQTFREPECDEEPIPQGLGLESDAEDEEQLSELEDNFVELAGGPSVKTESDAEENVSQPQAPPSLSKVLSKEKVLLMERFLYGDNECDPDESVAGGDENAVDEAMNEDDVQFEKMLFHLKRLSKSATQSIISGSSMMSEGLQFALNRDTRMLKHQCMRSDDLEEFDDDLKEKTLEQSDRLLENAPVEEQSNESEDEENSMADILSVTDGLPTTQPQFRHLALPTKPTRSRNSTLTTHTTTTDESTQPFNTDIPLRRKGESAEDRRKRKHAVKEQRRERRLVRKTNRENFRLEHERQLSTGVRVITIS